MSFRSASNAAPGLSARSAERELPFSVVLKLSARRADRAVTEKERPLSKQAGPGWYPDPNQDGGILRYWDGSAWSDKTRSVGVEVAEAPAPAAGWYPDPEQADGSQRFWDGSEWTERRQPSPPSSAPPGAPPSEPLAPARASVPASDQPQGGDVLPLAALAIGLAGFLFGFAPMIAYPVPLTTGGVALVVGVIVRQRAKSEGYSAGVSMAGAGAILGAVAFGLGIYGAVQVQETVTEFEEVSQAVEDVATDELDAGTGLADQSIESESTLTGDLASVARGAAIRSFRQELRRMVDSGELPASEEQLDCAMSEAERTLSEIPDADLINETVDFEALGVELSATCF